jgi:hypothetical protein
MLRAAEAIANRSAGSTLGAGPDLMAVISTVFSIEKKIRFGDVHCRAVGAACSVSQVAAMPVA